MQKVREHHLVCFPLHVQYLFPASREQLWASATEWSTLMICTELTVVLHISTTSWKRRHYYCLVHTVGVWRWADISEGARALCVCSSLPY